MAVAFFSLFIRNFADGYTNPKLYNYG